MKKPNLFIVALMLAISIVNYSRIQGTENIRAVEFVSIFAIGALSALLILAIVKTLKSRNESHGN